MQTLAAIRKAAGQLKKGDLFFSPIQVMAGRCPMSRGRDRQTG